MWAKYIGLCMGLLLMSCNTNAELNPAKVAIQDPGFELVNGVLNYKDDPFSGVTFSHYPNGNPKKEIQYAEGRKNGTEKHWFLNATLALERHYIKGVKTGVHQSWWENGQLKFVYHFNDKGANHGAMTEWYANGTMAKQFNYNHGKEQGAQKLFKPNGAIKANYVVANGDRYGLIGLKKCYTVTKDKDEIL